ncbi:MAG: hypothetical protein KAH56_10560 [Candidatus Krumholzibacteria bacterium]|nr:hypothetical protein [Candidatus Krumholzibacteria bacterium]
MNQALQKISTITLEKAAPGVAGLLSLFIVSYPIFDCDLYWHLANGRAMVAARRIINEDVVSFTHFGKGFVNHEWLSQTLFYLLWDKLGPNWLWAFKLLLSSLVIFFIYRTVLAVGGSSWLAGLLCVLAMLVGIQRYHLRPELFTLLNMAILGFILHTFRCRPNQIHRLWFIPFIFVVWDWLHGAILGLTFFTIFTATENFKSVIPMLGRRGTFTNFGLKKLNICFALTMVAMVINPYGLRSYGHFMVLARGTQGADKIIELQPMWQAIGDHIPFVLMFVWVITLIAVGIRNMDITEIVLVLVFGGGALYYNRFAGVAAIVLVPVIARHVSRALNDKRNRAPWRLSVTAMAVAGVAIILGGFNEKVIKRAAATSPQGMYILPSETAFGFSVNEFFTPAGSVRFIEDLGLQGNMYNNANLGGYLSYYLAPGRRIFQYNLPPIFGDTTRFVRNPRELDQWHIEYALAGSAGELTKLFPSSQWAWVYSDYVSTLVVKRIPRHQPLIDKYEIQFFSPEQSLVDYQALMRDSDSLHRFAFEMGVYLTYMEDERIAGRWEQLFSQHPDLLYHPPIRELINKVIERNDSLKAWANELGAVQGFK